MTYVPALICHPPESECVFARGSSSAPIPFSHSGQAIGDSHSHPPTGAKQASQLCRDVPFRLSGFGTYLHIGGIAMAFALA